MGMAGCGAQLRESFAMYGSRMLYACTYTARSSAVQSSALPVGPLSCAGRIVSAGGEPVPPALEVTEGTPKTLNPTEGCSQQAPDRCIKLDQKLSPMVVVLSRRLFLISTPGGRAGVVGFRGEGAGRTGMPVFSASSSLPLL